MPSTPFNTPRGRSDQEVVRDLGTGKPYVSSGHHHSATAMRVGGGFDTTHLLKGVMSEEDRLASEWRAMEYRGNPIPSTNKSGSPQQDLNTKAAQAAPPYNETLEHFLAERKSNRLASNSFLAKDAKTASQLSGSEVFEFSKMDSRRQFVSSPGGSTLHHQHLSTSGSRHVSPGAASSSGRQKSRLLGKLGLPSQPPYSSAHHTNLSSHLNASQGQIYAPHTTFQPLLSAAESQQASATSAAASGALVPVNTSTTSLLQHQQHQQHNQSLVHHSNVGNLNESHVGAEPAASPIRARDEADHDESSSNAVDLMRHTVSSQGKLRIVREKEIADAKLFSERYVSQQYDKLTRDSKADGAIDANGSSFHAPNQQQQQQQHLRHFNPSANTSTSFAAATVAPDVTGVNNIPGNNTTTQGQGSNYTVTNSSMLRVLKNSNHLVSRVVERSGVNLSCCGGGGKAPPAAGTNVSGLFVSYCQNDVHVQLENARRRLEMEEGAREYDNDVAYDRIAALTAENQQQAAELEQLRLSLVANDARFRAEISDLTTLKEEYAVRFREANEKLEKVQSEKQADAGMIKNLQRDLSNGNDKTQELERTINDLKTNLAAAEAQLVNNAKYTTLAHEDKVRALAEAKEFKNQLSYFTEKMKTKDQLLRGSETALKFVEGKLAATHHINSRQQLNQQVNRSRN